MEALGQRILVAFFTASLLLSACAPGQLFGPTITPSPTLTPTLTVTPSPTLTPTPTPTQELRETKNMNEEFLIGGIYYTRRDLTIFDQSFQVNPEKAEGLYDAIMGIFYAANYPVLKRKGFNTYYKFKAEIEKNPERAWEGLSVPVLDEDTVNTAAKGILAPEKINGPIKLNEAGFRLYSPDQIQDQMERNTGSFTYIMGGFAIRFKVEKERLILELSNPHLNDVESINLHALKPGSEYNQATLNEGLASFYATASGLVGQAENGVQDIGEDWGLELLLLQYGLPYPQLSHIHGNDFLMPD